VAVETRVNMQVSLEPSSTPDGGRQNHVRGWSWTRTEREDWFRTSSDLLTSLEVSRSNRLRLSLPGRMLAGLRARERFGFRRIPTIHCFPAQ